MSRSAEFSWLASGESVREQGGEGNGSGIDSRAVPPLQVHSDALNSRPIAFFFHTNRELGLPQSVGEILGKPVCRRPFWREVGPGSGPSRFQNVVGRFHGRQTLFDPLAFGQRLRAQLRGENQGNGER